LAAVFTGGPGRLTKPVSPSSTTSPADLHPEDRAGS
jgi:hypothetical protein